MKKGLILLLAAVLTLCTAGCAFGNPGKETETLPAAAETTEIPAAETEALPQVPSETRKTYEETITVRIYLEGEPMDLAMDLFDGGSYVIYIPQNEWTLETSVTDGYLTDRWVCSFNDMIDFQVISFGDLAPTEAEAYIRQEKSSYVFNDSYTEGISGMDNSAHYFLNGEVLSDGKNTFGLLTEFPMEAGDGFGGRTAKMMDSFEIKE